MAKAVKRKGTAPPRAGNKRVAVKSRKPSRKNKTGESRQRRLTEQSVKTYRMFPCWNPVFLLLLRVPTYLIGSGQSSTAGKAQIPVRAIPRDSLRGALPRWFRSSAKNSSNA